MPRIILPFISVLLLSYATARAQTIVYVSPNGSGDGSSWTQTSSLIDAVNNAPADVQIWLKQGIYEITQTLEFQYGQSGVSLFGGFSGTETNLNQRDYENNETVLDGLNERRIANIDVERIVLDGLTMRHGFVTGADAGGAAVYIGDSETQLRNCMFAANVSRGGRGAGAVYNRSGSGLVIDNCLFENNENPYVEYPYGSNGGGAIHNWAEEVTIINTVFRNNSSGNPGGAIYTWYNDDTKIENCRFVRNHSEGTGGAIFARSQLTISNTDFAGNTSDGDGGAISNGQSLTLSHVTFRNNRATDQGGGLYTDESAAITNALFDNNRADGQGGAIYNRGGVRLSNATFVNNQNSAFVFATSTFSEYSLHIYNSIFYNNTATGSDAPDIMNGSRYAEEMDVAIRYNSLQEAIEPDWGSDNLVGVNPLFADPANGIYQPQSISPVIDAGNTGLYNEVSDANAGTSSDLAGNTRLLGGVIDMGAYEVEATLPSLPECTAITAPADGAADVPLDAAIAWAAADGAEGYRLYIGTAQGGTDVADGVEVTGTTYAPEGGFTEGTVYYVTVIPYNAAGEAAGCGEISFTTETPLSAPECTAITAPADGAADVPLDAGIAWVAADGAEGYRVYIGTAPGGTDVADGVEVTGTTFTPEGGFTEGTVYYVSVIPYNAAGEATGCGEISFTTETPLSAPECTAITAPADGAADVPLDAAIAWVAADGAEGYRLYIGTAQGGTDVADGVEVTGTAFTPEGGLTEGTVYYVTVIPYNAAGEAAGCGEISFTTETPLTGPECTAITAPADGAADAPLDAAIAWAAADGADGYRVYVGTAPGGTDVADGVEVTGTTFTPEPGFEQNTTYYISVIPYNAAGEASGCTEISFTTETPLSAPECTAITAPADGAADLPLDAGIAWVAADGAEGYRLYIGTAQGGTDVADGVEVTGTTYAPEGGFTEGTVYYVSVIPYNAAGEATGCGEISFTTETPLTAPECTAITAPADGAADVPLDAAIAWAAADRAEGYRLYIGTAPGGTDVADGVEVTGTAFTPEGGFTEGTVYYVTVIPYNAAGEAAGCGEISFTTETPLTGPECTAITAPADGAADVPLDAAIAWAAADRAEGYRVYIGTAPGASDVADGVAVTAPAFTPEPGFEQNTTYYISVIPYNAAGEATGCGEISFTTEIPLSAPECTAITAPADGAADVPLDAAIAWAAADRAEGYRVYIGTAPGGTDVADGVAVTAPAFTPEPGFEQNTTYYISVIPYNAAGEATGCGEISFTTETPLSAPECTAITAPADGAADVPLDAAIAWAAADRAEGYRVYIGTAPGGTDVADGVEVTGTAFTPEGGFTEGTVYYVTVIPYNAAGEAAGCGEISFTTETPLTGPECTAITTPADGAADVPLDAAIAWAAADGADGYRVYIGTAPGASDVADGVAVTAPAFTPEPGFEQNTTYYISVIPYNAAGEASGCTEISFTTGTPLSAPECTAITAPADGAADVPLDAAIAWVAADGAEGYRVYIGTAPGSADVVNGREVTGTTFTPEPGFKQNTTYHVRVVPYNAAGEATGCGEISFTTETPLSAPECTAITAPADGAADVPLDAAIAWVAADGAEGYRVYIGTAPGSADVVNGREVTGTTFTPEPGFKQNTTYHVRVVSYNAAGEASGCIPIRFTIKSNEDIARTKYGISPNGDGINDFWKIDGIARYPDNIVSVYNRWGDMVFQIQQYDNRSKVFTGNANRLTKLGAGVLPSGTYFFVVQYRDQQEVKKVEGFLVLKR